MSSNGALVYVEIHFCQTRFYFTARHREYHRRETEGAEKQDQKDSVIPKRANV
jgi:hypothetical protein